MKKFFCIILFSIVILTSGCNFKKKSNEIKTEEQLIQAIEHFQYDKREIKLYAISNFIVQSEFLSYKGTQAPLYGFYTGILHEQPKTFQKLYMYYGEVHFLRLLKLVENSYESFESTLENTQKFYPEGKDYPKKLWGYFYATGDQRTINILCKIQKNDYDPAIKNFVKGSLERNQPKFPEFIMKCD